MQSDACGKAAGYACMHAYMQTWQPTKHPQSSKPIVFLLAVCICCCFCISCDQQLWSNNVMYLPVFKYRARRPTGNCRPALLLRDTDLPLAPFPAPLPRPDMVLVLSVCSRCYVQHSFRCCSIFQSNATNCCRLKCVNDSRQLHAPLDDVSETGQAQLRVSRAQRVTPETQALQSPKAGRKCLQASLRHPCSNLIQSELGSVHRHTQGDENGPQGGTESPSKGSS
jgi:hypothetical protein